MCPRINLDQTPHPLTCRPWKSRSYSNTEIVGHAATVQLGPCATSGARQCSSLRVLKWPLTAGTFSVLPKPVSLQTCYRDATAGPPMRYQSPSERSLVP